MYQGVRQLPGIVNILKEHDGQHKTMIEEVFMKPLQVNIAKFILDNEYVCHANEKHYLGYFFSQNQFLPVFENKVFFSKSDWMIVLQYNVLYVRF